MGFEIEKMDGFFEIRLSGELTKVELLTALAELVQRDPGKQYPDMWIVGPEVHVPYVQYGEIVAATSLFFTQPPTSNKTALIASDDFQKAQLELYRDEAAPLPLEIRVFRSREEAVAWFQ